MTTTLPDSATNTLVLEIPVDRIEPSSFNPRRTFDGEALDELAASIAQHGLIEPIVVRTLFVEGRGIAPDSYELIAGERRWRAAKQAGLETIPAMVREVDDATAIQLTVIENLQRQDLDPIEEASGFQLLLDQAGMTQRQAAEALNRSQPAIANALRLLRLPETVQQLIRDGKLTRAHGVALMRFDGFEKLQIKLAEMAVEHDLASKDLEKPFSHYSTRSELERAGVITSFSYEARRFQERVCATDCPFNAYRKSDNYGGHVCLNPSHYRKLKREDAEQQAVERQEAVEAAVEAAGDGLPKLEDLSWDAYKRLKLEDDDPYFGQKPPVGCSADCPCRAMALDREGEAVVICTDVIRFEDLQAEARRAEKARKREILSVRLEELEALVDEIPDLGVIGPRELAVVAAEALARSSKPSVFADVAERQGLDHLTQRTDLTRWSAHNDPDLLGGKMSSLQIIKLALEVTLREELENIYTGSYPGESTLSDYYLGEIEEEPERTTS